MLTVHAATYELPLDPECPVTKMLDRMFGRQHPSKVVSDDFVDNHFNCCSRCRSYAGTHAYAVAK